MTLPSSSPNSSPSNLPSSYLSYLPQVLWAHGSEAQQKDAQRFLGDMLRIFEKILTGIPDGVPIGSGAKTYLPLEEVIDRLPHYFDPWRTPDSRVQTAGIPLDRAPDTFLSWLASWVALTLQDDWTEYQRRKITAEIVSIYRLRGLEQGLHAYLDLYSQTRARPRIAIDDGKSLIRVHFAEDGMARLTTIAHSQAISFPATAQRPATHAPILTHPAAIAVDSHNDYFVIDQGVDKESDITALQRPALWKISSMGDVRYATGALPGPLPQPIQSDLFFRDATAAVVDSLDRCCVINVGEPTSPTSQRAGLRRFAPPNYERSTVIDQTTTPKLPVVRPVDMVLDAQQRFIILDRGAHLIGDPPTGFPAAPGIVVVREGPLSVEPLHALPDVVEPTALVQAPDGTFIVADARHLASSEPANLWRVDPANNWTATPLLSNLPAEANPLIFVTGMVFLTPGFLLVCDAGLRWGFEQDQSNRSMAEPAAIFGVDLSQSPPRITRVTRERTLVNPTKMVVDRHGQIILCERGESLRRGLKRNWRARANEFGVVVHFSQLRPTTNEERNRTRTGIAAVVDEQKPGHTSWWLKSE